MQCRGAGLTGPGCQSGSAIGDAGYPVGKDGVAIALDPAASEFNKSDGSYLVNGQSLSSEDMIARYVAMVDAFPIWSIEDGLLPSTTPSRCRRLRGLRRSIL